VKQTAPGGNRIQLACFDALEELVANPVCLDNASVEWIAQAVRAGDKLQVWERAAEFA
jgi:hypothetical protein